MKIYKTDNGRPPFKNRFSVITQQPSRLSNFSEILRWVAVFRRISEMEQITRSTVKVSLLQSDLPLEINIY